MTPAQDGGAAAWAYIARETRAGKHNPIGTVCAAVACNAPAPMVAKELAKWARSSLTIEHVPTEWVRKHLFTTEPYVAAASATP